MSDAKQSVVLITGAAAGIGLASAQHLSESARRLILVDKNADALDRVATSLTCDTDVHAGDVADEGFWAALDLTGLTHAVLNAGIAEAGAVTDMPFSAWRRVMAVNLDGAFLGLQACLNSMADGGAIVLTSSATGLNAKINTAAYGASKAGLMQLMRVAAKEAAPRRIRINAIAPAGVETPMWSGQDFFREQVASLGSEAAAYKSFAADMPLGRFAKPQEIAAQIAFLLSDDAAMITGTTLVSDGGFGL
jgi:2-keto-3-deoxy-L-fuconate dehydrogenase